MKNAVRYLCAFVLALGLLFAGSALAALPSGNTSCTWYWSCEGANRMIVTIADNSALYSSDKAYFKDSAGTTILSCGGYTMAGQTCTIEGDTMTVQISASSSRGYNGLILDSIECVFDTYSVFFNNDNTYDIVPTVDITSADQLTAMKSHMTSGYTLGKLIINEGITFNADTAVGMTVENYGTIYNGTLTDVINRETGVIDGPYEKEDGEYYYDLYINGKITNYGIIRDSGFGSTASVAVNTGSIAVDYSYNSWGYDEGYGWEYREAHASYGSVIGEGWYYSDGTYAGGKTYGLTNSLKHQWTKSGGVMEVKTSGECHITSAMLSGVTSIEMTVGDASFEDVYVPVTLTRTYCDTNVYWEPTITGGTFHDTVTFTTTAHIENSAFASGSSIVMKYAGSLDGCSFADDVVLTVDGPLTRQGNLWSYGPSYPYTYDVTTVITENGSVKAKHTFNKPVTNNGTITSGVYNSTLTNNGTITFTVDSLSDSQLAAGDTVTARPSVVSSSANWKWYYKATPSSEPVELTGSCVNGATLTHNSAEYNYPNKDIAVGVIYPVMSLGGYQATGPEAGLYVSGTCSSAVSWYITGNKLYVSGSGAIPDYVSYADTPWAAYRRQIAEISVGYSVTRIGNYAFANGWADDPLTSASINYYVASIGEGAFYNCYNLKSVVFDSSGKLTSIGKDAFYSCSSLESVALPSNLMTIGQSAFGCCYKLASVSLPTSVRTLGASAFINCEALSSVTFNSTVNIPDYAFYNTGLTTFTVRNYVTSIGSRAFGSTPLTRITIPRYVTYVASDAFIFCDAVTVACHEDSAAHVAAEAADNCTPEVTPHTVRTHPAVEATCETEGKTEGSSCTVCQMTLVEQTVVPATGHTPVTDAAVDATCEETGLTEGSHCEVCGKVLTAQEEVPATGHTSVTDAAVEATCEGTGLTEGGHCEVCGKVLTAQGEVPALGHTPVTDEAVDATCEETGLTEGSHCDVCGKVLTAQEEVPATGHTPVTDAAVDATCEGTGLTEGSHCDECGKVLTAQEEVPATGHTPVTDAAVDATCEGTGLTEGSHCEVCGKVLVAQEEVSALGHTPIVLPALPATHITTGLGEGAACDVCGKILTEQKVLPVRELLTLQLPAALRTISEEAFAGSMLLECVVISDGCTSIRSRAFADCTALAVVEIPASVTDISLDAFAGCMETLVIVTTKDSPAAVFAEENNIFFVLIENQAESNS